MSENAIVVNLQVDRNETRRAFLVIVLYSFALIAGWWLIQAGVYALTESSRTPNFNAIGLLLFLPYLLCTRKETSKFLPLGPALLLLTLTFVVNIVLGDTIPGFLSHWTVFTLGNYRQFLANRTKANENAALSPERC